jgi:hypothetical protein
MSKIQEKGGGGEVLAFLDQDPLHCNGDYILGTAEGLYSQRIT